MFRKVSLLVVLIAAAESNGFRMDGRDVADSLIDKSDSFPTRNLELEADAKLLNSEEGMSVKADEYVKQFRMDERRGCTPTISCDRLSGYCLTNPKRCNGTVDPWGCKGTKKCKCCIPDQPTPAPCFTTTSPGPTVNPALAWLTIGSDRFVRFPQEMDWFAAKQLCEDNGVQLYHPTNFTAVAIYLKDNFSDSFYWLGARGNSTAQVWLPWSDGDILTYADPWSPLDGNPWGRWNNGTNCCLNLITSGSKPRNGQVLGAARGSCSGRTRPVLCG